jgi:hypothetical protein
MEIPTNHSIYCLTRYCIPIDPTIHPLVRALRLWGIVTAPVEVLINGGPQVNPYRIIPPTLIRILANKLRINIRVSTISRRHTVYANTKPSHKPYDETIHLSVYRGHYFVHERTKLCSRKFTALNFIDQLTYLDQILWERSPGFVPTLTICVPLSTILNEQREFEYVAKRLPPAAQISYADIECVTQPRHVPLMYGRYQGDQFYLTTVGYDVDYTGFQRFLEDFSDGRHIVYFHNLKYDWNVICQNPHIRVTSILKSDGNYYSVQFRYFKKHFEFRDSYKYIPRKLADFSSMFQLTTTKLDCILYDLYTPTNTTSCDSVSYRELLPTDIPSLVYELTATGVTPSPSLNPNTNYILLDERVAVPVDYIRMAPDYFHPTPNDTYTGIYYHTAHMELYLHADCKLLSQGMEVYRSRISGLLDLDCHSKLTLPSLIHEKLCSIGCYKGLYQLTDNLRRFVTQSVHGGRVASRDNKKWDVVGMLQVLDGRSLYPSAISRICKPTLEDARVPGFPRGPAKLIVDWTQRDSFTHYVVRIRVTAIGKYQQIPLVTYYRNNSRHYTNRVEDLCGEDSVVDKITLEDWIRFQEIEYEFIEGIYWEEGGNCVAGAFVEGLYAARREYTEAGNESMSQVCKLALNSLFGKLILKPKNIKTVIRQESKVEEYLANNFEDIRDIEQCGKQSVISVATDDVNHYNLAHAGGLVLSMARRIMNEVLSVATALDIPVLYTDTDSLHIVDRLSECNVDGGDVDVSATNTADTVTDGDVDTTGSTPVDCGNTDVPVTNTSPSNLTRLSKAYLRRYGRDLLGSDLGQFATELKFPDHTHIYSHRVIILGKKSYLHVVTGTNSQGVVETYEHYRMKGINGYAMNAYPERIALYERLFRGESVAFDLAYGNAPVFQIRGGVTTRPSFVRYIRFEGEVGSL